MTCCAHIDAAGMKGNAEVRLATTFTRRHWMWGARVTSAGAALAAACSAGRSGPGAATATTPADAAAKLLRDTVSVNVHTHGGATGVTSKSAPGADLARGPRLRGLPRLR